MNLQELCEADQFRFSKLQTVRTTTYSGGEVTIQQRVGKGTTGIVLKANDASVRAKLKFRDRDREDEIVSLKFDRNSKVEVELV